MLSEKAIRILRKIGNFTEEQLETMSEAEAWHHIYAHDQAKSLAPRARNPEVCFSGFTDDVKAVLIESAIRAGFTVRDSVTRGLTVLVAEVQMPEPHNVKLAKAEAQGVHELIISASRGPSLAIDQCPPVENVASFVNGFLIHVVVSHRHLHVTVA